MSPGDKWKYMELATKALYKCKALYRNMYANANAKVISGKCNLSAVCNRVAIHMVAILND